MTFPRSTASPPTMYYVAVPRTRDLLTLIAAMLLLAAGVLAGLARDFNDTRANPDRTEVTDG